jgi:hypothetical protein
MAHLGTKDKDWANYAYPNEPVDCYSCKKCNIDFSIKSKKAKGKEVACPLCEKKLAPHTVNWRY